MRHTLLIIISMFTLVHLALSQKSDKNYLKTHAKSLEVSDFDIENAEIVDMYTSKHNGVTHIYYNQKYNNIPVLDAILVLNITKDEKLLYAANDFVPELSSKINSTKSLVAPGDAILATAAALGIADAEAPVFLKKDNNDRLTYARTSYSDGPIEARQIYYVDGEDVKLAWELVFEQSKSDDSWSSRVDALTAEVIELQNRTIYCQHSKDMYHNHSAECRKHDHAEKSVENTAAMMPNSYRVYPVPVESPIHGPHEVVTEPHIPAASPFGWHDIDGIEGPEYTITRGNNVHAYDDSNNDQLSEGDEPDGGADLIFDFVHDLDAEPEDNVEADVVNLFYANNVIHDITYLMGFDEEAGNFQANNYGNGGLDSDFVIAHSLDGAGENNANFSLSRDGVNGNMNMFRWSIPQSSLFTVSEPMELDLNYQTGTASGGWGFDETYSSYDLVAEMAPAYDNDLQFSNNVCGPVANSEEIEGKIAMIYRGRCEFGEKALNAQDAGAIAVVICNVPGAGNDPTSDGNAPMGMAPGAVGSSVTIPVFSMGFEDCNRIVTTIEAGSAVTGRIFAEELEGPAQVSSGFDNGIIFHEFAHGISSRLTGGPNQVCLGSDEQMGEGWSDFFALALTVEPGDRGGDARGIGNFVVANGVDGRGIRRFPYSTDMAINPQTYNDIKATSAPHPLGEVWQAMLWDIFWAYVDKYGYDSDWSNTESGNFRAVQLVMDGMKMQGCNPGFIRGRDGILAAEQANTGGENNCMIWDIFARRGLGFFADGGDANNRNDGTEDYNTLPSCLKTLKIYKDIPQLLALDEEVPVQLRVVNHIDSTLYDLAVIDDIPEGMSYVPGSASREVTVSGNQLIFDYDSLATNEWSTINFTLVHDNSVNSEVLFNNTVESPDEIGEWERELIEDQTNIFRLNSNTVFPTYSGESCWFVQEIDDDTEASIRFNNIEVTGQKPAVRFWHRINTEFARNGGFVEISTDGVLWSDARELFIRNGYECPLAFTTFAIPGLQAFSGRTEEDEYIDSWIDLSDFIGQSISLRFRFGSNSGEGNTANDETFPIDGGWFIDDIDLIDLISDETLACISNSELEACTDAFTSVLGPAMISSDNDISNLDYGMRVYPNPADDFIGIEIKSNTAEDAYIELLDIKGQRILSQYQKLNRDRNFVRINSSNVMPGFYVLQLRIKDKVISEKIVIK